MRKAAAFAETDRRLSEDADSVGMRLTNGIAKGQVVLFSGGSADVAFEGRLANDEAVLERRRSSRLRSSASFSIVSSALSLALTNIDTASPRGVYFCQHRLYTRGGAACPEIGTRRRRLRTPCSTQKRTHGPSSTPPADTVGAWRPAPATARRPCRSGRRHATPETTRDRSCATSTVVHMIRATRMRTDGHVHVHRGD